MKTNSLLINREFIKFLGAGGFAALVNLISRVALSVTFNYVTAIILAYCIGMITAYSLCRLFVFPTSMNTNRQQMGYFTLINLIAILQTTIISLLMFHYVCISISDVSTRQFISHCIGVCIPVFTSYLGHKLLTFRQERISK